MFAPALLEVLPAVFAVSFGLNARTAQLVIWNDTLIAADNPSLLYKLPPTCSGPQFVGLNVKSDLSMLTSTCWICKGIPSKIVGILYGPVLSVVIVNAAVSGSTSIFARTITFPRSNGPAFAGFTIDRPNGAPLYGPVM